MRETYLSEETYSRLIDAVTASILAQYAHDGKDALKLALGEIAGIWPESCRPDDEGEILQVA